MKRTYLAPFLVNHRWQWHRITFAGSKYPAIHTKAAELGATMWDPTQLYEVRS